MRVRGKGLIAAALAALALASLVLAPGAAASQLIDRNATAVRLSADAHGRALLTYRAHGTTRHVLAWGALDARLPNPSVPQVELKLDYRGGTVNNTCRPYDGPALAWLVTACRAADGSYWAVQAWQRGLSDYGGGTAPWELRLSHWTGPLAELEVYPNWAYGRFATLFGRMTYKGVAVHGFKTTSRGVTLDSYGRNLYLDTFGARYGAGWRRENSFVAHNPSGMFCYGFYPHGGAPGTGSRYRITVIGPGVTPDVMWTGDATPFDATLHAQMNDKLVEMRTSYGDRLCGVH